MIYSYDRRARLDFSMFKSETYFPIRVNIMGRFEDGYASKSEIDDGQKNFKEAIERRKTGHLAYGRSVTVEQLATRGTSKELAAFAATGAKLDDRPDFGDTADDTLKAIKWLANRRKVLYTKAMAALQEAYEAADEELKKRYPKANEMEVRSEIHRIETRR